MARKRSSLQAQRQGFDVQADWSKGMIRDAPRTAVPVSALYDSVDFLLHQPGIMMKRGGTTAAAAAAGSTKIISLLYADFPGSPQLVYADTGGNLYKIVSGSATALGGSTIGSANAAIFRPGATSYAVFPDRSGATAPIAYNGTGAPAALGGSPPSAKHGCVYKTRLVLGNTTANPQRIYFSPTPDIASTWDTTNSWIDADYEVTGFAATSNMMLIFSNGHTERIIGSTPPPGSDMDKSVIGSVGCTDSRSIVVQENNVLFANPRGVYLTNGAGFASLTTEGQIESYWQSLFDSYDPSSWTICSGTYRSFYVVSIMNGSSLVDCLMCNVPRRAWWRLSNIKANVFTQATGVQDELYYGDKTTPRVVKMSSVFTPTSSNISDFDGTAVTPSASLRINGTGPGVKHFGFARFTYDMSDDAAQNPTLSASFQPGVGPSVTAGDVITLSETNDPERVRGTIGYVSQGVNFNLQQTGASSNTNLYAFEVEVRPFNETAGGQ